MHEAENQKKKKNFSARQCWWETLTGRCRCVIHRSAAPSPSCSCWASPGSSALWPSRKPRWSSTTSSASSTPCKVSSSSSSDASSTPRCECAGCSWSRWARWRNAEVPIRSNVYSDSSSRADGKSGTYPNGSHGGGGGFVGSNGSSTIKSNLMHSNSWHPKLNGFAGGQALERRGTKFSTLDFYQSTPESAKKGQQNVITEDERYGDGNLHIDGLTSDDPSVLPALDFYETGNERPPRVQSTNSKTYDEFYGDGAGHGVLREHPNQSEGKQQQSRDRKPAREREGRGASAQLEQLALENRSSWPKNDKGRTHVLVMNRDGVGTARANPEHRESLEKEKKKKRLQELNCWPVWINQRNT